MTMIFILKYHKFLYKKKTVQPNKQQTEVHVPVVRLSVGAATVSSGLLCAVCSLPLWSGV